MSAREIRPSLSSSSKQTERESLLVKYLSHFQSLGLNRASRLTVSDLQSLLPKFIDEELSENLVNDFSKDYGNAEFTLEKFLIFYIDSQFNIESHLETLQSQMKSAYLKLEETRKKIVTSKATETYNSQGLMNGSVLTVYVFQGTNLTKRPNTNLYIKLQCESQEIKTQENPSWFWNEAFTFSITKGTGTLDLEIYEKNSFISQVKIPLSALRDQMKAEQELELTNKNGEWNGGKIKLRLQWIWSTAKYMEDVARQLEENVELDRQEFEILKLNLDKMKSPFAESARIAMGRDNEFYGRNLGQPVSWDIPTKLSIYWIMFMSVLIMFIRSDFLNLMVGITALLYFLTEAWTDKTYKNIVYAILFSEIYDILWMFLFFSHWMDESLEGPIKRLGAGLTLINFFVKIAASAVFWKNSIELSG
ncbi:unnamed protein product [Blepharisma stoltei]|uniref:C2 domain-containing protein n=1 Tax=Blepharisma stoltei TaxID=1481888 RepID=A0AAU9IFW7_9CILI|nr:unnamed protein product [Blepharisma stoltei]